MKKLVLVLIALFAISIFATHAQTFDTEAWGIPEYSDEDQVYEYTGFVLKYNEEHEQAEWVAYLLTAEEAQGNIAERANNFREDPKIVTGSATLEDYRGSGYDRGHLAPAGDMKWSEEAMSDSFYMSNMSPQEPGFNRVTWRLLEDLIRDWAIEHGEIYIITGPVLSGGPYETIGEDEVSIPDWYYKVVMDYNNHMAIAFLLPNERSDIPFYARVVTIDTIEYLTGINFFPLLPDVIEEDLEAQAQFFIW